MREDVVASSKRLECRVQAGLLWDEPDGKTRWRCEASPWPSGTRLAWSPLKREIAPLFSTTRNIHHGFVGQWDHGTVGDFGAQGTLHFISFVRILCSFLGDFSVMTTFYCLHFCRIVCSICAFLPGNKLFLIRPVTSLCPGFLTRSLPPCI